jgi:uncharacterized membrane protein YozB (DUF420 family)
MQDYSIFPVINASLNGTAAILIGTGVYLIKTGRERAHKAIMVLAISASTLFLISYLYYHAHVGSYHFRGHGWTRPLYFTILITHTILAAFIVPLVIITVTRAWRGRYDRHRSIARWTYPLWLYVSITGVVVYLMLYKIFVS